MQSEENTPLRFTATGASYVTQGDKDRYINPIRPGTRVNVTDVTLEDPDHPGETLREVSMQENPEKKIMINEKYLLTLMEWTRSCLVTGAGGNGRGMGVWRH